MLLIKGPCNKLGDALLWSIRKEAGHTCRKSFWNSALGNMFQAIVSVIAVKIQFSSPSGVLRSVCFPGIRSMSSFVRPSCRSKLLEQNHRSATCRTTWVCQSCHLSRHLLLRNETLHEA